MKKILIFIPIILLFFACGHQKNPTGGKKDTIKPTIVSISPDEFSDLSKTDFIEITFSKPIDRSTIITGIYIYPPINQKKYKWDKNVLKIIIKEDLKLNSNYYISFNTKIKGEHNNPLDQNYIFIYKVAKLNENSISGNIFYETNDDIGKDISIKLLSADSTFIFSKIFTGDSYKIEDINPERHILTGFIDHNKNNRYDFGKEPFFREEISPDKFVTFNIEMSYADSIKPKVKNIKVLSSTQLEVYFSEEIKSITSQKIVIDTTDNTLPIKLNTFLKDKMLLLTEAMDSLKYHLLLTEITDLKDNIQETSDNLFEGKTIRDSISPEIIFISPKNGETISTLKPDIVIEFNELIFAEDISISLLAKESDKVIDLVLSSTNNKRFVYIPQEKLENYASYSIIIQAKDPMKNELENYEKIIFIPIIR